MLTTKKVKLVRGSVVRANAVVIKPTKKVSAEKPKLAKKVSAAKVNVAVTKLQRKVNVAVIKKLQRKVNVAKASAAATSSKSLSLC